MVVLPMMWTVRTLAMLSLAALSATAADAPAAPFAALRFFEGKWEGEATGEPGKGVTTREYRFQMDGRYLSAQNRTVWAPKSPGAKSEVHEDFGMFSYDRLQKKLVLRQFHGEGFVNEYTCDPPPSDAKEFALTTARIENFREGWRAREAYRIVSRDEFVETFSLAEPGKEFTTYDETRFKRVK